MDRHLPLLMTLALAACGGGGGGGDSPAPATAGTPTPTPVNSAVGQNGNIDGTALKSTGPGPFPLNAVTAHLDTGTGPTNGGVAVTDTSAPGTVSVTFDPTTNQITSMTYHQNGADHELLGLDGTTLNNPQSVSQITKEIISTAVQGITPNHPVVINEALNFGGFGAWATAFQGGPNDGVTAVGVFAHGSPTPASAIPTTGSATYTGDVAGFASAPAPATDTQHTNRTLNLAFSGPGATIGIDFAKMSASTSFTNLQGVSMDSIGTQVKLPDLNGTGSLVGANYTTALSGAGGVTGTANGQLNGPQAQETTGTFSAAGGGITMIGAFGAKR